MLNLCKIKEEEEKSTHTHTESGRPAAFEARPEMWCTRDARARMSSQTSKRENVKPAAQNAGRLGVTVTTFVDSRQTVKPQTCCPTALGSNYEMRLGDGSQLYNLTRILL